jgi:hypothetical protein
MRRAIDHGAIEFEFVKSTNPDKNEDKNKLKTDFFYPNSDRSIWYSMAFDVIAIAPL